MHPSLFITRMEKSLPSMFPAIRYISSTKSPHLQVSTLTTIPDWNCCQLIPVRVAIFWALATMTVITIALLMLAATSIASSQVLPSGYSCGWEKNECKGGQVNVATCNCQCPGHLLCCDPSILNDYNYPVWPGKAPFCEGQCSSKCGSDIANCWWKSAHGNGKRC